MDHVIIVDNGSDKKYEWHNEKIVIIRNAENKGLATALNQGIRHALSLNADWVLLLDHDSQPEPDMVAHMLGEYQDYPKKNRIGLIAPDIKERNTETRTRYLIPKGTFGFKRITLDTPYNDQALSAITSGSLIKADIFHKTGFMPEHFFIDYIDHAFCLKMKSCGYNILLVKNAVLHHSLGDKKEYGNIIVSHHSPKRRYTIFRNRIWLWKRYAATFPAFVMHDVLAASYDVLRIILFEDRKWEKCCAILKGIRDGLRPEPNSSSPPCAGI